jgi:hypothetical protein
MKTAVHKYESTLAISVGLSLFYLWLKQDALLYVAVSIGGMGLMSHRLREAIHWVWHGLARGIGLINSYVLLTISFFVFLVPIALLRRLLTRKPPMSENSFFHEREHSYVPSDMEKPW